VSATSVEVGDSVYLSVNPLVPMISQIRTFSNGTLWLLRYGMSNEEEEDFNERLWCGVC
jgi:hypothetical protein